MRRQCAGNAAVRRQCAGNAPAAASSGAAGMMSPFLSTRLWRLREASTSSSQVRHTVTQGNHWCICMTMVRADQALGYGLEVLAQPPCHSVVGSPCFTRLSHKILGQENIIKYNFK